MNATITEMKRQAQTSAPSLVFDFPGRTVEGWVAEVESDGLTLSCSRIDGEDRWTVDAIWRGSFPVYANGTFSRCTILRHPSEAIAAALDDAARA